MAVEKPIRGIKSVFSKLWPKVLVTIFLFCLIVSALQSFLNGTGNAFKHDMSNPELVMQIWTGSPHLQVDDWDLLNYIRKVTVKPSVNPLNMTKPESLKHYSQVGQSEAIDNLLEGRRRGFFVECGAADGVTFSNSLFFEKWRGWSGLLVEANPWKYQSILRAHRHTFVLHACLSTTNQTKAMDFQLSSHGGSLEDISKWKYFNEVNETIPSYPVQCFPLYSVLLALGVHHVDYFSLDVEGSELDVLKTIPFGDIIIDSLTIEFRTFNSLGIDYKVSEQKLKEIKRFMEETKLYDYKGVLPVNNSEIAGLDAVFLRKDVARLPKN